MFLSLYKAREDIGPYGQAFITYCIVSRNEKYPNQFFNRGLHYNRKCTVFGIDLDISARYFEARIFIDYSLLKKESFSMAPFIFSFS